LKQFFLFILLVVFIISCRTEQPKPGGVAASSVKNVKLNFLNLDKSRRVVYGDSLFIQFEYDSDKQIIRQAISVDNRMLTLSPVGGQTFFINTEELGGGYYSLRAEVMLEDSTAMRGSGSVSVVLAIEPPVWGYRLVETHAHDNQSYTQGLIWHDGTLFESAGLYARSDIRQVNVDGTVIQKKRVDDNYFAEGIALYNNELYQITWREKIALVYKPENLEQNRTFGYTVGNGEGWGLTHNGEHFIFSDGSANLYFLNSEDWSVEKQLRVFDHRTDVNRLNELEFVNGRIYANILDDNRIAVIDPGSGAVEAYWDLSNLLKEPGMKEGRLDVMNGIAFRTDRNTFLVTGKLWPKMFEIVPVSIN
jgi:glutaminyl-peptide cyclotransferase